MRVVAAIVITVAASLGCLPAQAAAFKGRGFSIQPPAGWQTQAGFLGAELTARPAQAVDGEGWANDQLLVTSEPYDPRRTCLDSFVQRKVNNIGHLAHQLAVVEEVPLTLGAAQATRLEVRYSEGPRELAGYVLVMAWQGQMITASLVSAPQRFEFLRSQFRSSVDSLRPASSHARRQRGPASSD